MMECLTVQVPLPGEEPLAALVLGFFAGEAFFELPFEAVPFLFFALTASSSPCWSSSSSLPTATSEGAYSSGDASLLPLPGPLPLAFWTFLTGVTGGVPLRLATESLSLILLMS